MNRISNTIIAKFAVMDAVYWSFTAATYGFLSTYMKACGLESSILSILLAVYMAMCFAGSFFWGGRCDKAGTNKGIFIPEFIGALIIAVLVWFFADKNLIISMVLYPCFGFMMAPLGSNLDGWMLRSFNKDGMIYGRARAVGSLGYALMSLVMGQLINILGYAAIPIAACTAAFIVLILAFTTAEKPFEETGQRASAVSPKELLKIKPYIFMLIILFLVGISISPWNNLKIYFIEEVGSDVGMLGVDSFAGVLVQAFVIFISGNLRKIPTYLKLFMVTALVMGTMVIGYLSVNVWMVLAGSICYNIAYGIVLPTSREISNASVPAELRNTAYSMSDATLGSFSGILALLYSGVMMEVFGVKSVCLLGMCIMVVPCVMALGKLVRKPEK